MVTFCVVCLETILKVVICQIGTELKPSLTTYLNLTELTIYECLGSHKKQSNFDSQALRCIETLKNETYPMFLLRFSDQST